jgi:hypothetical protein
MRIQKVQTRLSLGFSKKLENLAAAMALQVAYYNFCWRLREKGKSGRLMPTPAMQAGLVDTLWTFGDLYDNVMEFDRNRKNAAKWARFTKRLGRED